MSFRGSGLRPFVQRCMAVFISDYPMQTAALPWPTYRPYYLEQYIRDNNGPCGVPIDIYRMDDLAAVSSKYKVFIFPCA